MRLNPVNARRWAVFKANRRGYWSLWIFLVVFGMSLCAEVIANDKPLMVNYKGKNYFPLLRDYPESEFGGFYAVTDYHDPFVLRQVEEAGGFMIWPAIRFSYATVNKQAPEAFPSPPSSQNILGTDGTGRDVAARLIYGFRISVLFGLALTAISSLLGIVAGAVQGYFGGWIDLIFQRLIEIWTSIPRLYLIIIFAAIIAPGFWVLLGILGLFSWVALVGYVRAEFLRGRNLEYVRAARALGVSHFMIILRHIFPNAVVATMTFIPFLMGGAITTLTALDFLGLGLPPGSASLGELLRQGKDNLHAPWLGITAFLSIAIMLGLLVFIGEAARDALDPRKGQT